VGGYQYYDRRALIGAVPEKSREAPMEAASPKGLDGHVLPARRERRELCRSAIWP
jgi:hypothetical protein